MESQVTREKWRSEKSCDVLFLEDHVEEQPHAEELITDRETP